jgi:hypothetical protein
MAASAFTDYVRELDLPELIGEAEWVQDATETRGWRLVQASIDAHRQRLTARLVNSTTKAESIDYLRGQIEALGAMREAAEGIQTLAKEREREAIKSARAQESHV